MTPENLALLVHFTPYISSLGLLILFLGCYLNKIVIGYIGLFISVSSLTFGFLAVIFGFPIPISL